jgi:CHAD domain-containing protein
MEIFQPLYAEYSGISKEFESATDEVKSLQEHLGEIHDADVLVPRLEEHLVRLLKPGHGHDDHGELRTGVDLVDLDACQGVLTLCIQLRKERTSRYQLLLKDWARLRESKFFEGLVSMVSQAASDSATPLAEAAV